MKKYLKNLLIVALFLISAGGVLMHFGIHNPATKAYGYVPLISGIISAILLPILFYFRKTIHLAYILNGFTAIIGTITMAHFALVARPIWPDIAILLGKFLLGYVIFNLEIRSNLEAPVSFPGWRTIRYPNMGFWCVHLILLSIVYYLGNLLWR